RLPRGRAARPQAHVAIPYDGVVRAEVVDVVFAGAVLLVFGSAAAVVVDRVSRRVLIGLGCLLSAAAIVVWAAFALKPEREVAAAAAGLTVCAVFEVGLLAVRRLLAHGRD